MPWPSGQIDGHLRFDVSDWLTAQSSDERTTKVGREREREIERERKKERKREREKERKRETSSVESQFHTVVPVPSVFHTQSSLL